MRGKLEGGGSAAAILVGIAGFVVGAAWAGRPSAWYDEAATRSAVVRPVDRLPDLLGNIDVVHGLYYVVATGWAAMVGDSITALRVLSALGLGATAALTVLLTRRLAAPAPATAWAAGLSVVLLPGMSWAGVEARSYAWSAALAVLSSLLLVGARDRGGVARWVGYALALTVSSWWFLFSATMVLVHGAALALADRRVPRGWLVAASASGAATLPLLVLAYGQRGQVGHIDLSAGEVAVRVLGGQAFTGPAFRSHGDPFWYGTGAALAVLATAVVVSGLVRHGRLGRLDPLLLPLAWTWATLPTLAVAGAHLAGADIYQVRYLTFTAPAVALLVGIGLATYAGRARGLLAAGLVLAAVPGVVSHHLAGAKSAEDYRGMAELAEHWRADAVVFSGPGSRGIAISYPEPFHGTEDVLLLGSPADTGTLFGSNLAARTLDRRDVVGGRVLQFQRAGATRDAYARRLARLGCSVLAETGRGRYRATLLQC